MPDGRQLVAATSAASPGGVPVDEERWTLLAGLEEDGGTALRAALVATLGTQLIATVAACRDALGRDDREAIGAAAHRLRGAAANIGAGTLAAAAQRLGELARHAPAGLVTAAIADTEVSGGAALAALRGRLRSGGGASP